MDIFTLVLVAVLAMLAMAMGVVSFSVLYKRRVVQNQLEIERLNHQAEQDTLKASLRSEESERKRIAAELHDDIGASLSAVKLYLYNVDTDAAQQERLQTAKQLLDQTIQKVRNISHKLQPTILDHLGLEKALVSYAHIWNQSGGVKVEFNPPVQPLKLLPAGSDLQLYRMIQELLTNIIRHGLANNIYVALNKVGDEVQLCIRHDGKGMDQETYLNNLQKEGSTGLKNIQNRLVVLRAEIQHTINGENNFSEVLVKVPQKFT